MAGKNPGIYVHIPYCIKKCNYCDFNSYSDKEIWALREAYFKSLQREIELLSDFTQGMEFDTVYFGGGTPTAVEEKYIIETMQKLKNCFKITDDAEITIECNPKTADYAKLKSLRECGINRISIGMQSNFDSMLCKLGRAHNLKDFEDCLNYAKKAGFENITVDLMFGLPEQSISDWNQTLEYASSLDIDHISCYCLKVEENTPFYDMELNLPNEDVSREMYDLCVEKLAMHGFIRYEISNFAKNNRISKHNTKYWRGNEYIGLGSGASSFFSDIRYNNVCDVREYTEYINNSEKSDYDKLFSGKCESNAAFECAVELDITDKMSEFMFLGLRMVDGISVLEFEQRFGISVYEKYGAEISKLKKQGVLCINGDKMYIHPDMLYVSNTIMSEFV